MDKQQLRSQIEHSSLTTEIHAVLRQLAEFCQASGWSPHIPIEVEVRLGTLGGGKFVSMISQEKYAAFEKNLSSLDYQESVTYHYPTAQITSFLQQTFPHLPKTAIERANCRTIVDKNKETHQIKVPLAALFLENLNYQGNVDCMDAKISFSAEIPLTQEQIKHLFPSPVPTTLTRIRHRGTFYHKSWAFDLSQIYVGKNRSAAEHQLLQKKMNFEIEIEYTGDLVGLLNQHDSSSNSSLSSAASPDKHSLALDLQLKLASVLLCWDSLFPSFKVKKRIFL